MRTAYLILFRSIWNLFLELFLKSELLRKISLSSLKSTSSDIKQNIIELRSSNDGTFYFDDLKYLRFDFEETSALDQEIVNKTIENWLIGNL